MKIVILSRKRSLYSTARLVEAARKRGHTVRVIDPLRLSIALSRRAPRLYYGRRRIKDVDAVIPRIGASVTFYGLAVLRQFEATGAVPLNTSQAIARSRDKLHCLQILSREEVNMPPTAFARQPDDIPMTLKIVGGVPVVIKLLEGTQGRGVVLAESDGAAVSVIEAFHKLEQNILIQRFVNESAGAAVRGRDVRAFVIGRRVVAAMERVAKPGEFRSNLHRGGVARPIKLPRDYRDTAVRAASAVGLDVAGVDMLVSGQGPMILEVNSSPGLEGIETATGIDIATLIVKHLERTTPRARPREARRGRGAGARAEAGRAARASRVPKPSPARGPARLREGRSNAWSRSTAPPPPRSATTRSARSTRGGASRSARTRRRKSRPDPAAPCGRAASRATTQVGSEQPGAYLVLRPARLRSDAAVSRAPPGALTKSP